MSPARTRSHNVLTSPDPFSLLERLQLTTGRAAEFCGVSRRQLCYWTDKGLIPAQNDEQALEDEGGEGSRRLYDFSALYKVLLIKQLLAAGKGLKRASKEIEQQVAEREKLSRELRNGGGDKHESLLLEQAQRMEDLAARVRRLLPELENRSDQLKLLDGIVTLQELAADLVEGENLQQDREGTLKLANLVEQIEAKLEGFGKKERE